MDQSVTETLQSLGVMDLSAHMLKCSLKMAAVLVFVCVLPEASCRPQGDPIKETIHQIQEEANASLGLLDQPGLLPGVSCSSLDLLKLAGLDGKSGGLQNLPLFRCHMMKMSNVTTELESGLETISQYSLDVEELMWPGNDSHTNCSLPHFEEDVDKYQFVRCLLELLLQVLQESLL